MAENIPNTPEGAVPPKPAEPVKVQPKKETVRISLPPKPTAAPTVRIPAPSAVSASVAGAAAPSAAPPPSPVVHQAAAPAPAAAAAPAPRATVAAAPAPALRSAQASRPPVRSSASVGVVESALAVSAAVFAVAALVFVYLLQNLINS